jgi:hypothetical protein
MQRVETNLYVAFFARFSSDLATRSIAEIGCTKIAEIGRKQIVRESAEVGGQQLDESRMTRAQLWDRRLHPEAAPRHLARTRARGAYGRCPRHNVVHVCSKR